MKVNNENTLKIKLKGTDIDTFKTVISKMNKPQVGFQKQNYTDDETKLLKTINDKINGNE